MPARSSSSSFGFFTRHLIGHYPLPRAFWVHTVLLGWLLALLTAHFTARLVDSNPARYGSVVALVLVPMALLFWTWSNIGVFASALRRLFRDEGWFWSLVAMLVVVAGAQEVVPQMRALRPFLSEHLTVALGRQPGEPFTVKLVDAGRTVEFTGGVNDGAAQALRDVIAPAPKVTTVRLASPGGWMREGARMAEVIRYFRLNTTVSGACASACTVAFLAGLDRTAAPGAVLGFHSARPVGGLLGGGRSDRHRERAVYAAAKIDDAFIDHILRTPFEDVWIPTRQEMLRAGVLTR
jgi:hypothetical protein